MMMMMMMMMTMMLNQSIKKVLEENPSLLSFALK